MPSIKELLSCRFFSGFTRSGDRDAVKEHSIQLVIVRHVRDRITEIFAGDEIDFISSDASCEIGTVSS